MRISTMTLLERIRFVVSSLLAILLDLWWHGHVITVQVFPVVWLLRGHLVEKNEIFPVFQILFEQTSNAGECVLQ